MSGCCLSHSPAGNQAHNPGMCPDRESKWRTFSLQEEAQPTEPHQTGPFLLSLEKWFTWGHFVPQGTFGSIQRHLWLSPWGAVLLASSVQRPGVLLNIPQCTEQPPPQRIIGSKSSAKPRLSLPSYSRTEVSNLGDTLKSPVGFKKF